ncbi:hypothetical protein ILUMI_12826 [Ignelater luminosus]|uniref:Uncharacterized protein n=1 Tax=Ignelater luminosus TaxID=2038154 RepID=A0A8K0CZM6_IGNLU|nr:hypothetical protein ILUMI_12826 [Ignelater luminosus]
MAIWFLFQEAVVLVFFCGISYCDEDLLENLKPKRDDPPELADFLESVLKKKDEFRKIRVAAKEMLNVPKSLEDNSIFDYNTHNRKYGKHKLYDDERKLSKRFLQERPINDVYPYMSENEPENELEQDEREERSPWNEVREKPSNEYVNSRANGMRYRRGLDLNDYSSENDDARANIEVLPRSKSGVRNVPGNKYEHRRSIHLDRNNKLYQKRHEFSDEHDFLGFKKESSKLTEEQNKKDDRASQHNNICSDETLPEDPINAVSETKLKLAAKRILFNKDFVNQGDPPRTTNCPTDDGTNRAKRSMKLSIIDDNNLIKSVKHDSSSNSLILTLKMKDGKSKLKSSESTESKVKHYSRSNLPERKLPKKYKGFDVMELVAPEKKYSARPIINNPNQNKVNYPQEMAIIYRVDETENNDRESPSNYPLVSEKQNKLEDMDEPTSAIEQHELSTRPYVVTPSTTTDDFLSTTMEILKFKFADILTSPTVEGQFVVKEASDMVHGKILQKIHNLDKRTLEATHQPKIRKKNFPVVKARNRRRIASMQYNNYDYDEFDKLQNKMINIKDFLNDLNSEGGNEMIGDFSQSRRHPDNRRDHFLDNVLQDNSYDYEELQAIQSQNNFKSRKLLSSSEDETNSKTDSNDENKYGDLDYENGRSNHMNESGFLENKIRVKRNTAEFLDVDDDEYVEGTLDDYSPIFRKRSDDYAYEEEGDSAVGETQTYKEKKEDKSRTFDLTFYTAKSDDGEFTLADSFKSGTTTPCLNFRARYKDNSDLYRNRIKALTKVIHDKISKKNNKNSNAFKRMVDREVSRGCGNCKSAKCPNCHNKHCKNCKKVRLSTDDDEDEDLDKPEILKKIENLSTRLQLLNNEHEYWEKYRKNNYDDYRKSGRSNSNSTDHKDSNDNRNNKTKSGHNDDESPKPEKPKHDEDVDLPENKTRVPEHNTTESEKQWETTTHKKNDSDHDEHSTETTHKTTSSKKKITESSSNTQDNEKPPKEDEEDNSFEPKSSHNETTTESFNLTDIPQPSKKPFKKYSQRMFDIAEDKSDFADEIESIPIEGDSSETVGFAHHPSKVKTHKYNTTGKHVSHSNKLYRGHEENSYFRKSDMHELSNNDNEKSLKGFHKRYENNGEQFADLLDDTTKVALDPETNEDESLAEFSINAFKNRNNSSRIHHHKHKQIFTKKKSHRHTESTTEKHAIQLEKDESGSNNKNKVNRREIKNFKNLRLDTVDSFDDIVEEGAREKKISKREIVAAKELKKSIQEMKQHGDAESYVKTTNVDVNDAPFEKFSKFSEGYWKINPERNPRRLKSRNTSFQKRSNIFREKLPIPHLRKIKNGYYNRFLFKRRQSNPYKLIRYRRDTPNASKQKQQNPHNDKPVKVVETKSTKKNHENQNKFRKCNNGKGSQWSANTKPKCKTHLLGTDLNGINPNTALKTSLEKPNPPDDSEIIAGSKDFGQMHEALNGHLASLIVSNVFKKIKQYQQLHKRFSHGLYRKHGYRSEMKNLNAFRNIETEGDIKHTEEMLHQIMKVLNKIILDQVRRRTCKHLSPELQKYLSTLTKVSTPIKTEIDEESKISEEGYPLPLIKSGKKIEKPVDTEQGGFLFSNPANMPELEQDEVAIKKKMKMIRNLLDKYKHMSGECKVKVGDVEAYLKKHLSLLKRMLKAVKKQQALETKGRSKFPVPNKIKRKHFDSPFPDFGLINQQELINKQLDSIGLGPTRSYKPKINIEKLIQDNLNKIKYKEYQNTLSQPSNSHINSKVKYRNDDNLLDSGEDYEKSKSEHKREIMENENENNPKVSEKYKKLIQAAESIRKKRENEDRLGKLFGKIEKKSIKNEDNDMKLFDKDSPEFSHARFETPVVFSLKK